MPECQLQRGQGCLSSVLGPSEWPSLSGVSSSLTPSHSMFRHMTKGPEDSHGSEWEVTESSFWKTPQPPPPSKRLLSQVPGGESRLDFLEPAAGRLAVLCLCRLSPPMGGDLRARLPFITGVH